MDSRLDSRLSRLNGGLSRLNGRCASRLNNGLNNTPRHTLRYTLRYQLRNWRRNAVNPWTRDQLRNRLRNGRRAHCGKGTRNGLNGGRHGLNDRRRGDRRRRNFVLVTLRQNRKTRSRDVGTLEKAEDKRAVRPPAIYLFIIAYLSNRSTDSVGLSPLEAYANNYKSRNKTSPTAMTACILCASLYPYNAPHRRQSIEAMSCLDTFSRIPTPLTLLR